jgi:hypothetical protein
VAIVVAIVVIVVIAAIVAVVVEPRVARALVAIKALKEGELLNSLLSGLCLFIIACILAA